MPREESKEQVGEGRGRDGEDEMGRDKKLAGLRNERRTSLGDINEYLMKKRKMIEDNEGDAFKKSKLTGDLRKQREN